jgi:hypothetical protein
MSFDRFIENKSGINILVIVFLNNRSIVKFTIKTEATLSLYL